MILDGPQRRFLSRRAWQIYPAFYALGVYLGFNAPLVIPLLVAAPLLGVAVIFTLLEWRGMRHLGLVACLVALVQCAIAMLMVGRSSSALIWLWSIAMIVPIALTVFVLRSTQRTATRA